MTPEEYEAALARYEAIQRWREETGSREKYGNIEDEYLAWLSEDERKALHEEEIREAEKEGGFVLPGPTTCAMHRDGWFHPSVVLV